LNTKSEKEKKKLEKPKVTKGGGGPQGGKGVGRWTLVMNTAKQCSPPKSNRLNKN